MPTPQELEQQFWSLLKSDRIFMLGVVDLDDGHLRPMTAYLDGDEGPIWIFTAKDTELVQHLSSPRKAIGTFASTGHELFASFHGTLFVDNDPIMVDRLWDGFIAAWYKGGKTDPNLALLRFEPESGEVWEDVSSLLVGIKMLLGQNPKKLYRDKVAEVDLS